MRQVRQALYLVLLLITAQQGAVVHELSHFSRVQGVDVHRDLGGLADSACALCPAFAQATTPAFSHSFHIPPLLRAKTERGVELQFAVVDAAIPQPRSRGPPSLS